MALTVAQATAAATAAVQRYAPGAPDAVVAAAVHLMVQAIRLPVGVEQAGFADQLVMYETKAGTDLVRRSGAASLLAPYRRVRARKIEASA